MIDHVGVQAADVDVSVYHPGYCGVFLRDPDGRSVEAVFHDWSVTSAG